MGIINFKKGHSTDSQVILGRRVYIVEPRITLMSHLSIVSRSDIADYLKDPVVVMTKKVDFERHLEGWQRGTINAAKKTFMIENLIGEFCPFADDPEMQTVLGTGSYIDIFDKWFHIKDVDYFEIDIDWKGDI